MGRLLALTYAWTPFLHKLSFFERVTPKKRGRIKRAKKEGYRRVQVNQKGLPQPKADVPIRFRDLNFEG